MTEAAPAPDPKIKSTDHYTTPLWIAQRLGKVHLDPCWNYNSHIRADYYFGQITRDDFRDALEAGTQWPLSKTSPTFFNPPYSSPIMWCRLARKLKEDGYPVVLLLKGDESTRWYAEVSGPGWYKGEFPFRLAFGNGVGKDGAPVAEVAKWPSILVTNMPEMISRFPECRWMVCAAEPSAGDPRKADKQAEKPQPPTEEVVS